MFGSWGQASSTWFFWNSDRVEVNLLSPQLGSLDASLMEKHQIQKELKETEIFDAFDKKLSIILNWYAVNNDSTCLRASLTASWAELSLTPKNGNTYQAKVTSGRAQLSSRQH